MANGPAWHDRFPGLEFAGDPEAFVSKEQVADYFVDYAAKIKAPIRTGVEVTSVTRLPERAGFRVETSQGPIEADYVIAATGAFQLPVIPPLVPDSAGVTQLHSNDYRNPDALPPGAVLVVGAGSSGAQIADELLRAGRKVFLSVGPHDRIPRRYRGRDFVWWLGILNEWDADAAPGAEHITAAISGANGGQTVDYRDFAARGIQLLGRAGAYEDGKLRFAPDLPANIRRGDAKLLSMLDQADAWAARNGVKLPPDPEARRILADPACLTDPILALDLKAEGISTVLWATGFAMDFSWLKVDALDEAGRPRHKRGVSSEPGVYFLGLPYQSRRGSSFIWGVWHDAKFLADHIAKQRNYLAYTPASKAAE